MEKSRGRSAINFAAFFIGFVLLCSSLYCFAASPVFVASPSSVSTVVLDQSTTTASNCAWIITTQGSAYQCD